MVVTTQFPVLSFKLQLPHEQKDKMDGDVGKKKTKKNLQDQQHYTQAKFGPLFVFVNRVLLEHCHTHYICISYGCFHINVPNCVVVLNCMACKKKKNLYSFKTLTL